MKKIGFKLNNTLVVFECTDYTFGKLNSVKFNTNLVDLTDIDNTLNSINVSTDVGIVLLLLMESIVNIKSILDDILDLIIKRNVDSIISINDFVKIVNTVLIKATHNNTGIYNKSEDIKLFRIIISIAMAHRLMFLI